MKINNSDRSEYGSVLVYILIAVALFGALGFAVSNMMRGSGNIGTEKAGIMASEIIDYGRSLREAVQTMKISGGCEEGQISFERPPFDGSDGDYVNPAAPSGFSCHVFHPNGGGVGYQDNFDGQNWRFTSAFDVKGVGSASPELVGALHVNRGVCEIINTRTGVSNESLKTSVRMNDGSDTANILPAFTGIYDSTAQVDAPAYEGKMTGCYLSANSDGKDYTVYQILVTR